MNVEEHNILTLELIKFGYINENDIQIFYYDDLFEELLKKGNLYKKLIMIVHYIIPRVISKCFKDEQDNIISNKYGYLKNAILSNLDKLNNNIIDLWE